MCLSDVSVICQILTKIEILRQLVTVTTNITFTKMRQVGLTLFHAGKTDELKGNYNSSSQLLCKRA
jgi:hypothetical protein